MPRHPTPDDWRSRTPLILRAAMECVVLVMVVFSPWAYGAEPQAFLTWIMYGLGLALVLWAACIVVEWRWSWRGGGVSVCLGGLFLLGVLQMIDLPPTLLGWLAPRTQELAVQLLPQSAEELPLGEARLPAVHPAGSAVSLYPARTRAEAVKLLAVVLLFAAVQHNLASAAALGRLSLLATVNGALLSLFALVQFFSSPSPNLVYWTYPTDGTVFGPFICRNHFPFYVNICAGLCVGQMIAVHRLRADAEAAAGVVDDGGRAWWLAPFRLLHDPAQLWLSIALALMVTAAVFSLSRGGALSLLGAGAICLAFKLVRSRRVSQLETIGLTMLLVLGLAMWFGLDAVEQRLSTVWRGTALEDGRAAFWRSGLLLLKDFPLVGTGLGTWGDMEPLQRASGDRPWTNSVHAHNDYIEALAEGGLVRFALSVLAIILVYRCAWRSLRRYRKRFEGGLIVGALFGFTTVVLHSFVDFGLHSPAIALLATVLAAQLCRPPRERQRRKKRRHSRRAEPHQEAGAAGTAGSMRPSLAPAIAAGALTLLAVFLGVESSSAARYEGYRLTGLGLADPRNPAAVEQQLLYLEAATQAAPGSAIVKVEYAEALLARHRQALAALEPQSRAFQGGATVLAGAALAGGGPGTGAAGFATLANVVAGPPPVSPAARADADRRYLVPALAQCLLARDLCPLSSEAQLWLAARADQFRRADPRAAYLRRATLLRPDNPEFWYLLVDQQLKDGSRTEAWANWRQALRGSEKHLKAILSRCRDELSTDEIVAQVLPPDPERLLAAAQALHPPPAPLARRRPLLEQALALLEQPGGLPAEKQHLKARVLKALARPADAADAYTAAVALAPDKTAWRFELAQLLYQQGQLQPALEQLQLVLVAQPNHPEARALADAVRREMAGVK